MKATSPKLVSFTLLLSLSNVLSHKGECASFDFIVGQNINTGGNTPTGKFVVHNPSPQGGPAVYERVFHFEGKRGTVDLSAPSDDHPGTRSLDGFTSSFVNQHGEISVETRIYARPDDAACTYGIIPKASEMNLPVEETIANFLGPVLYMGSQNHCVRNYTPPLPPSKSGFTKKGM